jgi:hypothetical protein
MFSYSTGYYVSPPDDQYLKFKNRCSLMYMYVYYINISHGLAGSLVSVGVGPWHGMVKGACSNHLCVY